MWPFTPRGYKQILSGFIVIKGNRVYMKTIDGRSAISVDSIVRAWGKWPINIEYSITLKPERYFPDSEFYPVFKIKSDKHKLRTYLKDYKQYTDEQMLDFFCKGGVISSHILYTIRTQGGRYLYLKGYSLHLDY